MVAVGNRSVDAVSRRGRSRTVDPAGRYRRHEGQTVMFVAMDGRAAGLLGVGDPIKLTAVEAFAAAGRRRPHRDADRRQPYHRARGRAQSRD